MIRLCLRSEQASLPNQPLSYVFPSNFQKPGFFLQDTDVMSCCKEQNVTDSCLGICSSHQIDVDLLLYSPQCIPELDKLMSCGSGMDHV